METQGALSPVGSLRPMVTKIFLSRRGLRAGWRFALFNLLFFLVAFGFLCLRRALTPGGFIGNAFTPSGVALQEALFLVGFLIALSVMLRIERRPFRLDFLPLHKSGGRHFGVGAMSGICAVTLLICGMCAWHVVSFESLALHGMQAAKFAVLWAVAFFLIGIFEECFSRGYAQATLSEGVGFWPAAIVGSAIFAAIHLTNNGESAIGILSVFLVALFFCFTLWRTGTLWFAVGFHAAWDYGETFLYGVPDSAQVATGHLLNTHFHGARWITGGSVGPEGSALVFVVYALAALFVAILYPSVQPSKCSK